jgi:hypothetical protein
MVRKPRKEHAPWSVAGGPDPAFPDDVRQAHRRALTSADLLDAYRHRFPEHECRDYELVVRCLGYVWDCPRDGAASVVGYRCAGCGRTRSAALADSGRADNVAYVRRLCLAYADRGLDPMLELVPSDVEWIPQLAEGRVLRGTEELRAFMAERASPGPVPLPTRIASAGEHVVVRFQSPGHDPRVLWSVYRFEAGRLVRAVSFEREAVALNAAA